MSPYQNYSISCLKMMKQFHVSFTKLIITYASKTRNCIKRFSVCLWIVLMVLSVGLRK